MKLRTVLNELPCDEFYVHSDAQLDSDVIVSPEWRISDEGVICLGSLTDYLAEGAPEDGHGFLLVYMQGHVDERYHHPGRTVVFAGGGVSPSDFQEAFLHLVSRSGQLAVRRERLFRAYLESYDLRQFARRASEAIGNPVVISNTDRKVLASAGEMPEDQPDLAEVLSEGYITQQVEDHLNADGVLTSVRSSRHSVIGYNGPNGIRCVTSIIYRHRLEMGRFDAFEVTSPITGLDLELIDYATSLAGLMIDRLGVAGEHVGMGSSILADILKGKFSDDAAVRAHLRMEDIPLDGTYALVRIVGQPGAASGYYSHVGQMIGGVLSGCIWCVIGPSVVALLSLKAARGEVFDGYQAFEHRLLRDRDFVALLKNNDMHAFVSEPFSNMSEARERLRQCIALGEAAGSAPSEPDNAPRIEFFWDRRFEVLASLASGSGQTDMLLDKRVVAMTFYDQAHGSSYLETAVMSVRFPGSPAEAAAALSVHRNTYFYRVNKIRELFHLDLKDGDDRLALAFSARIIEALGVTTLQKMYAYHS